MDNLAHSLVGLAASKAGLEKLSPSATAVCIVSANVPDIDFLAALSGDRWTVLHHHRGLSHSIVGTLVLGLLVPTVFYVIGLAAARTRGQSTRLRFRGLLIASLITAATHPILDWTNSYGVRPLLPWSGQWFYGDIVFVVDPAIWVILGAGAFVLTAHSKRVLILWSLLAVLLTGLFVYSSFGGRGIDYPLAALTLWLFSLAAIALAHKARLGNRLGPKAAVISLLILLAYWGTLSLLHERALTVAREEILKLSNQSGERVTRLVATPTVVNPIRWRCLAETDRATYRFEVKVNGAGVEELVRYEKPNRSEADLVAASLEDRRTKLFFEFARFPVERILGADCTSQTLVQFADLRYTEPGRTRGSFSLEVPVDCPFSNSSDGR